MKILVLNCGSSSIKYKLFDMTTKEVIAQGGIEKIGLKGSFLKLTLPNGEKKIRLVEKLIVIRKQGWTQRQSESGGKQNNVYTLRKVYTLYKLFTIYRFMARLPDDCFRK